MKWFFNNFAILLFPSQSIQPFLSFFPQSLDRAPRFSHLFHPILGILSFSSLLFDNPPFQFLAFLDYLVIVIYLFFLTFSVFFLLLFFLFSFFLPLICWSTEFKTNTKFYEGGHRMNNWQKGRKSNDTKRKKSTCFHFASDKLTFLLLFKYVTMSAYNKSMVSNTASTISYILQQGI